MHQRLWLQTLPSHLFPVLIGLLISYSARFIACAPCLVVANFVIPLPPRDLRDQFLRFETETETEQAQSQQARPRPRLKRYSLNKRYRDRDPYSQIFETETETETRKMCIFETETETETRKMVETETETETLADLWTNLELLGPNP